MVSGNQTLTVLPVNRKKTSWAIYGRIKASRQSIENAADGTNNREVFANLTKRDALFQSIRQLTFLNLFVSFDRLTRAQLEKM